MIRTQIYITEHEAQVLNALSKETGQPKSQLIREAIDLFFERRKKKNRLALMRSAQGIWKDRKDLPDFNRLRQEWDRN